MMQCEHEDKPYHYKVNEGDVTKEGTVKLLSLDERDNIFREAGLVWIVARDTAEDVGCTWVFDPPINVRPGLVITIQE